MKKKENKEYSIPSVCHVCSKKFMARFNMGDRARVCTPPSHKCRGKTIKVKNRSDKLITCVDNCCRSKYYKGVASTSTSASLDSRKFLSDPEYKAVISESLDLKDPYGIGLRFTLETGCRCGETLLMRKS